MILFTKYTFDLKAFIGYIAAPGFALAFVAYGHRWFLLASILSIMAATLYQSLKVADAPAKAILLEVGKTGVPVINGDGSKSNTQKIPLVPIQPGDNV